MAIVCKTQEKTYDAEDTRRCLLLADETPETLPTTGVGVDALPDSVKLDGGSVLLALDTSSKYVLGNDGAIWHKWTN